MLGDPAAILPLAQERPSHGLTPGTRGERGSPLPNTASGNPETNGPSPETGSSGLRREGLAWRLRQWGALRHRKGSQGWKDIFLLGGRGLLFLAILTLIILVTTPWLTPQAPEVCLTVTEDENKRRQKRVREKQQETLSTKSSGYLKNVLKPRQETKLRKQEESFYQMMGETWKSLDGYKLGGYEEPSVASENGVPDDTPNREASRRRKLPEHVNHAPASPEQPRAKKGLVIPEEPPETAEEVVAIALRCPDGRVLRRRFCKMWSSQVLLDWMMKVGYHKSIYTLSTSYPRRPLEVGEDQTLEDAGLTTDTVLNVEEREPCPSL